MLLDPTAPPLSLLDRIGPDATSPVRVTPVQAADYCRGLALSHYENFSVLTSLVPEALRADFAAVYAFCRWADDLADETGADAAARDRSLRLLSWWRSELHRCFEGGTDAAEHPVFVALRATAERHSQNGLTVRPFADLISAFEQDQRISRYDTWRELTDYCSRSADPVGRIVLALGGYPPPKLEPANAERYRLSDLTCTALQLINFWQDVRRDLLERDRIYLPKSETQIDGGQLRVWLDARGDAEAAARVAYIRAVRPLVERTAQLFAEARTLPRLLDREIGPVVWLFGAGGEAIVKAVQRAGCTTLWTRPRLGKAGKAWMLGRAWCMRRWW